MPFRFGQFLLCGAMVVLLSGTAEGICRRYAVQLETMPCFIGSASGRGISENGLVTGRSSCGGGGYKAFIWNGHDPIQQIDLNSGITEAEGIAINDQGVVSGRARTPGSSFVPFRTVNGVIQLLPHLNGGTESEVAGMNEAGMICGYSYNSNTGNPPFTAVEWLNGAVQTLQLPLGRYGVATNINEQGDICGWMGASATRHAFVWREGIVTDIGMYPGHLAGQAMALNDVGQVAGQGPIPNPNGSGTVWRSWMWEDGTFTSLCDTGECTEAYVYDMNDAGQVVGQTSMPGAAQVGAASIWEKGHMRLLGNMTDLPAGMKLLTAYGINNAGQITGDATINGAQLLAFILTPIPPLAGDTNCDHVVNIDDLTAVILNWGSSNEDADVNEDDVVDSGDLMEVITNWTAAPGGGKR